MQLSTEIVHCFQAYPTRPRSRDAVSVFFFTTLDEQGGGPISRRRRGLQKGGGPRTEGSLVPLEVCAEDRRERENKEG